MKIVKIVKSERKNCFRRAAAIALCFALLLGGVVISTSCAAEPTVLLSLEGQTISVNHYELILSRLKASNAGFTQWSSIADLQTGRTYDDVARQSALATAKQTLIALVLFEKEGLTLPESSYTEIDQNIQDMMNADSNGSKAGFNEVLSAYGVNIDILRDIYIKEAKAAYVKEYLYGEDKLTDTVRGQFLEDNVAAFKQIAVRAWAYVYQTDDNGDIIYYKTNENNDRVNNIAYDESNGYPHPVKGQELLTNPTYVSDANGDIIYYVSSGSDRIAYDTTNGVPAHKTGTDGQQIIKEYTQAERNDLKEGLAAELLASVKDGSMTNFEEKMTAYYQSLMDPDKNADALSFLYTTENYYAGATGSDMLTDMADALRDMEVGDVCMVESEAGFHIIMKYETPSDAATNDTYASWFEELDENITNQLFNDRCAASLDDVVLDDAAWSEVSAISMEKVNANYYY